jgi:rare lipoprotein A
MWHSLIKGTACAAMFGHALMHAPVCLSKPLPLENGIASVYAYSGEETANGERANPGGLTAAHKTLPFGTLVRVTNDLTGQSVVVRINDRGPFVAGRIIDLTPAGAAAIGSDGLTPVSLDVVGWSET